MLDYIKKFNNLPPKIRNKVAAPEVIQEINAIGKRYQINLASTVMRVMIKEIDIRNLANYFINNFKFDQARAQHLENELKDKIFSDIINYLYRKESLPIVDQGGVPLTTNENDYWDNKIDHIINRSGLSLGSDAMQHRLSNILLTYLKHVRDKLATKDALTKSFESGGLGLDEESANNLILLADDKIKADEEIEIRPPARINLPEDRGALSREADYNLEKALAAKQQGIKQQASPQPIQAIAPPPPAIRQQPASIPAPKSVATSIRPTEIKQAPAKSQPAVKPQAKPAPRPQPINNLQKTEAGKVKMDDIKATPKVFTPIDELRYMTLKNFRNLDADPMSAIDKIKEKLRVLKSDDYGKMVAGIKAWKISPVNKLYLKVYNEGLQQGKSAHEILQQSKTDQAALTEQEFEAIIKLNQELKF